MVTVKGIGGLESLMRDKKRKVRSAQSKAPSRAATFMKRFARKNAAHDSGETRQGIIKEKKKRGSYWVISDVTPKGSTGFKQNQWQDRRRPHRSVRMFWNRNKKTVYGDGTHRTTGTPGFFTLTAKVGRKKFKNLAIKEIRNALG